MAEPISLIASVAGLLDVTLRSSKALHSLQSQLRNAPNLIQALSNEVEDLKAVLARVEDTTNASKTSRQHAPVITATTADLEAQLQKAKAVLADLDILTNNLAAEKPTLKRIKWCLKQSRASELQSELKEVRTKINELLVAHNSCISTRIHLEVCDIRLETQKNQHTIVQKLDASSQATNAQLISTQQTINQSHAYTVAALQTIQEKTPDIPPGWHQAVLDQLSAIREEAKANRTPSVMKKRTAQGPSVAQENPAEAKAHPYTGQSELAFPPGFMNCFFFITLGMMKSGCQSSCQCRCHLPRSSHSWGLPRALHAVIGSLFIGYTSNPVVSSKCDLKECSKARSIRLRLGYKFPLWFLNYTIHMLVETSTTRPFTLGLVSYRRLQDIFPMSKSLDILELTFLHKIIVGQCHVDLTTTLQSRSPNILAQIDEPDIVGETPLMYAARLGHVDQVKALIDGGADVNVKRKNGIPALSIAANAEIVDLLIRAGVDVHATDGKGTTALHLAARRDKAEIVEKLLSMGAMVNLRTLYGGLTPLHLAAQYNSADAARLLCSLGGDIEAKVDDGRSPLNIAIQFNSHQTIADLLELGADYLSQDHGGSFLYFAAKFGDEETLRILASFEPEGVDIDVEWVRYEIFECRSEISEDLRSAFYSFIEVVIRNRWGKEMSGSQSDSWETVSDSDNETFVDAAEFPEQVSHV
ncbi:hypothetical protein CEP52_012984 [Fusarium oligoseptatum]|uniref:Azaphilone pigments biosynthesis cluster protein L N-terminal domain-containing protein n=1 Tax=Fusarium oligoseptatum TaxID=2604345 RepID=A0A428SVP8_9HYPO|nr:hypothetical protein CEP52_012984 [Fusarium oligoseptatum]